MPLTPTATSARRVARWVDFLIVSLMWGFTTPLAHPTGVPVTWTMPRYAPRSPLLRTVPLGGDPSAIAVDIRHRRVFVVNQGNFTTGNGVVSGRGSVSVLDAATGRLLRTVSLGTNSYLSGGAALGIRTAGSPVGIDGRTNRLFVETSDGDNHIDSYRVHMLDATTGAVLRIIRAAGALVVDEALGRVYLGGGTILDARTGAIVDVFRGGSAFAVASSLGRLYVGDYNGNVTILAATTGKTLSVIHVGDAVFNLAVDEQADRLLVMHGAGNEDFTVGGSASIYDATTGKLIHDKTQIGWTLEGIDEQTHHILAVAIVSSNTLAGPVSVMTADTRSGKRLHEVTIGNTIHGNGAIAIDQGRSHAIVTIADGGTHFGSNTLSVIDTRIGHLLRTLTLGAGPSTVAFDRQTDRFFVANQQANTVDVLDAARL